MNSVERQILLFPNLEGNERIFLLNVLGELNEEEQLTALQIYSSRRKDPQIVLLLAVLGLAGLAGIHRLFLGQILLGLLYFFTVGLCWIGTIYDLFNYRELCLEFNRRAAAEAVATVKVRRR
jgi:TM2 domain-containing membrane protein YozV